jgi:hypothetical protein
MMERARRLGVKPNLPLASRRAINILRRQRKGGRTMPRNGAVMLLAGLLLAGGAAGAAGPPPLDTTRDLLRYCDGTAIDDTAQQDEIFCDGFITGAGLFYLELVRAGAIKPWACAEPVPDLATVRGAFVRWARSNPQHLDAKPIDGFWRAMADTYPCAR